MAAGKELLADVLEGVLAVQLFLIDGLCNESLSPGCEVQLQNATRTLNGIVKTIQNAHPSIRPRVNTPGNLKKPPAPPPNSSAPVLEPPSQDYREVYEDPAPDHLPEGLQEVEDYLKYSQTNTNGEMDEIEQEMYEAMETGQQDVYEEPVSSSVENYEDPINLKLTNNMATTNSPPPPPHFQGSQREISLEEGLYAETLEPRQQELGESLANMSMDWGTVYATPPKGGIMKVSTLSYVKIKGSLEKLGGKNRKTWQRRYCVLSGALMYFYEKENSKTYNNCIAVPSFKVSNAPNITSEKKKQFGFKLTKEDSSTGKSKDYYFRASTIEFRDKWVSCIKNVGMTNQADNLLSPSAFRQANSVTLPRMSSQASPVSPPTVPQRERRAHSEGVEEEGELYEEMVVPEDGKEIIEEDDGVDDQYIAVCPEDDRVAELESSEEYVAIVPLAVVEEEDKTNNQRPPPPPPLLPPPGPPSEVFTHPTTQAVPFFKPPAPPPPPSEPEVDTNRMYLKDNSNGIVLERVYVSQWNFAAVEGDELELKRGDLVFVSKPLDSEMWWYGELLDAEASRKVGLAGFFPKDYSTLAFEALSCQ